MKKTTEERFIQKGNTMTDNDEAEFILNWILSNKGKVEKRINGALKDAIHAHSDITKKNLCSASKRVWGAFKSLIKELQAECRKQQQVNS